MSRRITARAMATPARALTAIELPRAIGEIATTRLLRKRLHQLPEGDQHGVMVLPGFLSDDRFNTPLRNYLDQLGYRSTGWGQGVNLGPTLIPIEVAAEAACEHAERTGDRISLVGHSLGGIYAREIAKLYPDIIRQVITLGSPFSRAKEPKNFAGKLFRRFNPDVERLDESEQYGVAPPHPTSAIYTRLDGVIGWGLSVQKAGHDRCENIEVRGSHCGLTHNAAVWYVLADRLAQNHEQWQPFARQGWRNWIYPPAFSGS